MTDSEPNFEFEKPNTPEPSPNQPLDLDSLPQPQRQWLREYTSQLTAANKELEREIAARKETERKLRESEALHRVTLLYTMRAITERKKLEAENKRLTAQFYNSQKMQSVGRLAGGIAHDFNNMLSVIQMNADLVKNSLSPGDSRHLKIQQIGLAAEHAAALTNQLLAFSRNQVLLPSIFNLNHIIENLNPILGSLFSTNILFTKNLQKDLWLMKGDASQVEQVILNLCFNAADAMPKGGTLVITTTNIAPEALPHSLDPDLAGQPWVMLEVADTGGGIKQETLGRIFEPFFTTRQKGTGLGLATTQRIVTQNGGKIVVESQAGQGTTFKIYLPPVESPAPDQPEPGLEVEELYGQGTILLVEDENSLRQLVGDTLREYGYQVFEANDSESGLALVARHKGEINLLLTDFSLPIMDGRQLYRRLSAVIDNLRVLYISGFSEQDLTQEEAFPQTATFLQKPFTIEQLLTKVRQSLT